MSNRTDMLRILLALSCMLVVGQTAAQCQRRLGLLSSMHTEVGAGAALDLVARGPWIAPQWRHNARRRILLSLSASLIYEYIIEPWNGTNNAANWRDAAQRLEGTVGAELAIGALKFLGRKL